MSLFGSLMADVEDDPFFGSHMRHMRQMNSFMMNSLFSDPFGMMGLGSGGPLAITGQAGHGNMNSMNSMMPFMPRMPSMNSLFSGLEGARMGTIGNMGNMGNISNMGNMGNIGMGSYSSSTVVVTNGPNGKAQQVFSSSSSTKIGPNGIKETRKTLEDSRTGTKKMSIGHHIGERAHLIEREQNVYTGDAEENQEFINLDEDEAEDFDREFKIKSGQGSAPGRGGAPAICAPPPRPAPAICAPPPRHAPRLALPAPPAPPAHSPNTSSHSERKHTRPSSRRPIRTSASPLATNSVQVREVYSAPHPQRKSKHNHNHKHRQNDN